MKNLLGQLADRYRSDRPTNETTATAAAPQELIDVALVHHGAGRLAEAEALYSQALAADAANFDAMHMLGVLHQQKGDSARAAEMIERAIAIAPGNHFAHGNLGLVYQAMRRLDKAESSLRTAIALRPDWDGGHNSLGTVLHASGKSDEAFASFREAVLLNPANADALGNLGNIHRERGQRDEALACLQAARDLQSGNADRWVTLGSMHAAHAELAEAEDCFRGALRLNGQRFDATCNLADVLRRADHIDAAELFARKALVLRPDDPDALNTLACVLLRRSALDEAEGCCRKALSIRGDDAPSLITLGNVLNARNRSAEAEECFRRALRARPDSAIARYNLAMGRLSHGDYTEGFALYESRFDMLRESIGNTRQVEALLADNRRWLGEALSGRRLLVWVEQGFGDTLMMLRYLPLLKARGYGELIVLCGRELARVVTSVAGLDRRASCVESVAADEFDLHCPITSLPLLFGTTFDSIPDRMPYVTVPDAVAASWKARLSPAIGSRVGLAWAGRQYPDPRRSIPLFAFAPILKCAGFAFVSLQKGEAPTDVAAWHGPIEDWMDRCDDFMDTAGLIANLDLVISLDSAVAHLAGAMGKPVWLLHSYRTEWRWGATSTSRWYPSMRIFRQEADTGWEPVMARVASELAGLRRA